jgi:dihydroflavonol-4-reductase
MNRVLVTGATGFLGSLLVERLLAMGCRVRAFVRPSWKQSPELPPGTETLFGDVRDADSLARAAEGCDTVFHTAAVVSFRSTGREEQLEINVGGTRKVVAACLGAGVSRLIHTSSVAAVGRRTDGSLADETTEFNWPSSLTYRWSKHLAELEVLDGVSRGLAAVIVNPSVIIGPGDRYIHGGQLVRDAARGRLIAYTRGGMNMVGVGDVVDGHISAAEVGKSGRRYILGGVNLTHREAFRLAAGIVGGRPPVLRIPRWAVMAAARAAEFAASVSGAEPIITPDLVAGAGSYQWFSTARARAELNFRPLSLEKSIRDAYIWYRQRNLI